MWFHVFMFTAQTGTQDAVIWGNSLKVTSDKHTNCPPTRFCFRRADLKKNKKKNREDLLIGHCSTTPCECRRLHTAPGNYPFIDVYTIDYQIKKKTEYANLK